LILLPGLYSVTNAVHPLVIFSGLLLLPPSSAS
jgi:hypothetical protein